MMMPPAGSMLKVSGRSIATVAAGPSPGRMPTTVPRKQPTKHQRRLAGCSATEKPCRRPLTTSISDPEQPDRELNSKGYGEGQMEPERNRAGRDGGRDRGAPEDHDDEKEGEEREAQHEAERLQKRNRHHEDEPGAERASDPFPIGGALILNASLGNPAADQEERQGDHQHAVPEREKTGARPLRTGIGPGPGLEHDVEAQGGQEPARNHISVAKSGFSHFLFPPARHSHRDFRKSNSRA